MFSKFLSPSIRKSPKIRNSILNSSSLEPRSTEDLQNQKKQNRQSLINVKDLKQLNSSNPNTFNNLESRSFQKERKFIPSPMEVTNTLSPFTLSPFKPVSKRWSLLQISTAFKKNPERMSIFNRRGSIEEVGRKEEGGEEKNERRMREERVGKREVVTFEGPGGRRNDGSGGRVGRRVNSDLIEGRMNRIRELEGEIGRIKEELYGVLVKMKESLIMDEDFDNQMKELIFSEDTLLKAKNNDCLMSIQLIKTILSNALMLKVKLKDISESDVLTKYQDGELDFVIILKKMELDLKQALIKEENSKFIIEMATLRSKQLEYQNKLILEQTWTLISDYRRDYDLLLSIIKEQESSMKVLNTEINQKKDLMLTMESRMLSMHILEQKISYLQKNFDLENRKLINQYEIKLKSAENFYKNDPVLAKTLEKQDDKLKSLEKQLKMESRRNFNLSLDLEEAKKTRDGDGSRTEKEEKKRIRENENRSAKASKGFSSHRKTASFWLKSEGGKSDLFLTSYR